MARTNFTLPDELNKRADEEAKRLRISKAALINIALSQYFEKKDSLEKLPEILSQVGQLEQLVKKVEELKKASGK